MFGGTNIVVSATEKKKGGLLMRSIAGDLLRVWESKPQVVSTLFGFHHYLVWSWLITLLHKPSKSYVRDFD